jgi:hypothetical protein
MLELRLKQGEAAGRREVQARLGLREGGLRAPRRELRTDVMYRR